MYWVGGPPGVGKSAVMAAVAADAGARDPGRVLVAARAFRRANADDEVKAFAVAAVGRLAGWLAAHHPGAWAVVRTPPPPGYELEPMRLRAVLGELESLLRAAARLAPGGAVAALVLDGVDELAPPGADAPPPALADLVALARKTAGPAVRWVFAGRDERWAADLFPAGRFAPLLPGGRRELDTMAPADLRDMLLDGLPPGKRAEVLALDAAARDTEAANPFVAEVCRRAGGFPFYVRLVLDDLARGVVPVAPGGDGQPGRLDPAGLRGYVDGLLDRAGGRVDTATTVAGWLLVLLAELREPVPRRTVPDWVRYAGGVSPTGDEVRAVLDRLRPLLDCRDGPDGPGYGLFHDDVRRALLDPGYGRLAGLAAGLRGRLAAATLDPFANGTPPAVTHYILRKGVREHIKAVPPGDAARLLEDFGYHARRLAATGPAGLTDLVNDLDATADRLGPAGDPEADALREWARMYRRLAPGLVRDPVSEEELAGDALVDRVATLALGWPPADGPVARAVRRWARDAGRVGRLFTPVTGTADRNGAAAYRWVKGRTTDAARVGDRVFIPRGRHLEVVDFGSFGPNRTLAVPALYDPEGENWHGHGFEAVAAVPDTADLVVATADARLARVSADTGEVLWGPVTLPEGSRKRSQWGYNLAVTGRYVACRGDAADQIMVYRTDTGEELSAVSTAGRRGWWDRLWEPFKDGYRHGLLAVAADGRLVANSDATGAVYAWADPVGRSADRVAVAPNPGLGPWALKAAVRLLALTALVALPPVVAQALARALGVVWPAEGSGGGFTPAHWACVAAGAVASIPYFVYAWRVFPSPGRPGRSDPYWSLRGVAITPGGRAVLCYRGGGMVVADPATGRVVRRWDTGVETRGFGSSAAAALSGERVAVACEKGRCQVWDVAAGRLLTTFQANADDVRVVLAAGPDVVTIGHDWRAWRWRPDEAGGGAARLLSTLAAARGPDGRRYAVTSGFDGTQLWDLEKPAAPLRESGRQDWRTDKIGPSFTADGRFVVGADFDAGRFLFWDVLDGTQTARNWDLNDILVRPPATWPGRLLVGGLRLVGRIVFARRRAGVRRHGEVDRGAVACDTNALGLEWVESTGLYRPLPDGWSADRARVATNPKHPGVVAAAGGAYDFGTDKGRGWVAVWDAAGDLRVLRADGPGARGVALTDAGDVVVLDNDGLVAWPGGAAGPTDPVVLDRAPFTGGSELSFRGWAVAAGGRRVAVVRPGGPVALWDVGTGEVVREWHGPWAGDRGWNAPQLAATDDGRLVTASGDMLVRLWDPACDTPVATFPLDGPPQDGGLRVVGDLVACVAYTAGLTVLRLPPPATAAP